MNTKRCRPLLLVTLGCLLGSTLPANADRMPSRAATADGERARDLARASDLVAREQVARALSARGLSAAEAEARLARLSDADLHRLAGNLSELQAAGNVPNYVWIALAAFLIVSTLALIF
jgi:hypothetical protein